MNKHEVVPKRRPEPPRVEPPVKVDAKKMAAFLREQAERDDTSGVEKASSRSA